MGGQWWTSDTADELADDSGDDKRLEKAERMAERKAAKRKKISEQRTKPYRKPLGQPATVNQIAQAQTLTPARRYPSGSQAPAIPQPAAPKTVGPCFACGLMGHLRSYCPKVAAGNTKAWYPPLNDTTDTCVVGGGVLMKCPWVLSLIVVMIVRMVGILLIVVRSLKARDIFLKQGKKQPL